MEFEFNYSISEFDDEMNVDMNFDFINVDCVPFLY